MKIKIELDGLTLDQATDLTKFLSSLKALPEGIEQNTHKVVFNKEDAPVTEEKPKATRKRSDKVAELKQLKEEEIEDQPEPEEIKAIEVKEPETVSAPTLMQIRSLVAAKAADNKEAIKAKLVELGAQNVSTLDAKHFQTIFDFLTEL